MRLERSVVILEKAECRRKSARWQVMVLFVVLRRWGQRGEERVVRMSWTLAAVRPWGAANDLLLALVEEKWGWDMAAFRRLK